MIKIRPFEKKDQEQVAQLVRGIMEKEFQADQNAYPLDDLANVAKTYGADGDIFYVAEDGHKIVGTAAVKREDGRVALLRRLFVDSNYRKKRVGADLIEHALQFCRNAGYQEIIFKATSKMNAAIQICLKSGFVQRAQINLGNIELHKLSLLLNGKSSS
jgi:N-acetylglutamate synthase-like GNAT family acetyltransferase